MSKKIINFWYFIYILICIFTISSCSKSESKLSKNESKLSKNESIRFDGIYRQENTDRGFSLLRFYNDGTVIAVSTEGKLEKILTWFTKDKNREIGKYKINNLNISFSTISRWGNYKYKGTINNEKSILDLNYNGYSYYNEKNYKGKLIYKFIKVDFPK